jgi:plastocyanin
MSTSATISRSPRTWLLAAVVLAVALAGGTAALTSVHGGDDVREVTIRAKSMEFHVDGVEGPNPTIILSPGEHVRLVLVNEDHGFKHNLVIPALDVRTDIVEVGQRTTVELTVPAASGSHDYTCEPHAAMMRGNIAIE